MEAGTVLPLVASHNTVRMRFCVEDKCIQVCIAKMAAKDRSISLLRSCNLEIVKRLKQSQHDLSQLVIQDNNQLPAYKQTQHSS